MGIFVLEECHLDRLRLDRTGLRLESSSQVDEISEILTTLFASLDPSTTTFFTRELPDALATFHRRLPQAIDKEAATPNQESHFVESLIEAALQKSLHVSTKDAGRLAAKLLQLRRSERGVDLPEAVPPRLLQHIVRLGFVETMKRFNNDDAGAFGTDPMWQLGWAMLGSLDVWATNCFFCFRDMKGVGQYHGQKAPGAGFVCVLVS